MKRVLLLNATHEVLKVISLKRAIVLVLEDKAEVLEAEDGEYVRSASMQMPCPSVIRLKFYVKVPWKAKAPLNRRNLMSRDKGQCQRVGCNRRGDTIDHIVPRAKNGRHDWLNVTLMCRKCNQAKGDRLLSELGWSLKTEPTVPQKIILIGVRDTSPSWESHLALAGIG